MGFCRTLSVAVMLAVVASSTPSTLAAQDVVTEPHRVRLEMDDLRRFAALVRTLPAQEKDDTVNVIERNYMALASPGLRAYADNFRLTAAKIASAMAARPSAYSDIDGLADAILAQEDSLRAAFQRLRQLFPRAAFPPVWFIVGNRGPGGLTRSEGVLVAAERFAGRPEDIIPLVLHELAHFQQAIVQGVDTYRRIYGPEQTLLALALREGSADLVARLTTGRHINPAAEQYGIEHEEVLWCQFRKDRSERDAGEWMFVEPAGRDKPADLGYWVGYRIVDRYYDRADDKAQAMVDILGLTEFEAFLQASGYGNEFLCDEAPPPNEIVEADRLTVQDVRSWW